MRKILIYGTGNVAKKYINDVVDVNTMVVGVLDNHKFEGDFYNHPILYWDDIKPGMAERIYICAQEQYIKKIYNRIFFDCIRNKLDIYSWDGRNLSEEYKFYGMDNNIANVLSRNAQDLYKAIDEHSAISFDLFDTLIMRKTLEPVDVFDLVEDFIKEKGISLKNFKYKRRTAELLSHNGSIDKIYEILKCNTGVSAEEADTIKQYELNCEKEVLMPRTVLVDALKYAKAQGKRVYIISDMYLSKSYLKEVLSSFNIHEYDDILVSNEYGTSKSGELFKIYKELVPGETYLHIGDNYDADVISAKKQDVDSFQVLSALEMLRISSIRECLVWASGTRNRRYIGELIGELFTDPFVLYTKSGLAELDGGRLLVEMFVLPTVIKYCNLIKESIQKNNYDGILFGARDGYLIKKVYEKIYPDSSKKYYFMTSRKAACRAALRDANDIDLMQKYFETSYNDKKYTSLWDDSIENDEQALCIAKNDLMAFRKYCKYEGIDLTGKFLFCELISGGTVHNRLDRLFDKGITAIYVHKKPMKLWGDMSYIELYKKEKWKEDHKLTRFLEKILTAPHPSAKCYKEDGTVEFAKENRTQEELNYLCKIQEIVLEYADERYCISDELAICMLRMIDRVNFIGELEFFNSLTIVDDLNSSTISVL